MIKEAIAQLVERKDLTAKTAEAVMNQIMSGEVKESQLAAFLTALRMKGETVEEIIGCARAMRAKVNTIKPKAANLVDTCGTGGDKSHTFNISTTAAFVVAGVGIPVAKHGNRAVSSKCGSADLMTALGVKIQLEPKQVADCIDSVGIGFMFAPTFHPAMKYAIGPRREMGIRTIFNILGPLTNPAGARAQVLGVFNADLTEVLAKVLGSLGSEHVFVVHGMDGTDEISITGETQISELNKGTVKTYFVKPEDFGIKKVSLKDITASSIEENVNLTMEVLEGKKCPARDVVVLNAAAGIVVGDKAASLKEGIKMAEGSIDSGQARQKLDELKKFTSAIQK